MKISSPTIVHFINPVAVINQLGVKEGSIVADFGCGSGYFSIPLAKKAGKEGIVYSYDVLPQALESVQSKAKIEKATNIITRRSNLEKHESSKLPKNSVDYVVMKDVLFQNSNREAILREAHRILKKEGKGLIVEWDNRDFSIGPQKEIRISRENLSRLIKNEKFRIEKIIDAGHFHYAFVIVK